MLNGCILGDADSRITGFDMGNDCDYRCFVDLGRDATALVGRHIFCIGEPKLVLERLI